MRNENDATQLHESAGQQLELFDTAKAEAVRLGIEPPMDSEDFELPQPQHCSVDICESCQ